MTVGLALRNFSQYCEEPLTRMNAASGGDPSLLRRILAYSDADYAVHDTVVDVQPEAGRRQLNGLAASHGFSEAYPDAFAPDEVGVVSIIDKAMRWHDSDASPASLTHRQGGQFEAVDFTWSGFNTSHYSMHRIDGFAKPVVRIAADPGASAGTQNYMWATELPSGRPAPPTAALLDAAHTAITAATPQTQAGTHETVRAIVVPRLDRVQHERRADELCGVELVGWRIALARQQMRVTVDDIGAMAAAITTGMFTAVSIPSRDDRETVVLGNDGPLLVWFTEGPSRIPICVLAVGRGSYTPL